MFGSETFFYCVVKGMCLDKRAALEDKSSNGFNIHALLHSRKSLHSIAQANPYVLG